MVSIVLDICRFCQDQKTMAIRPITVMPTIIIIAIMIISSVFSGTLALLERKGELEEVIVRFPCNAVRGVCCEKLESEGGKADVIWAVVERGGLRDILVILDCGSVILNWFTRNAQK